MARSLIGTEVYEVGATVRKYLLEKWRTESGYELCVLRLLSHTVIFSPDESPQPQLVTTYVARGLDEMLQQARSDLDHGVIA